MKEATKKFIFALHKFIFKLMMQLSSAVIQDIQPQTGSSSFLSPSFSVRNSFYDSWFKNMYTEESYTRPKQRRYH